MSDPTRPGQWRCPYGCRPEVVKVSDAWVFSDAIVTIILSVLTIAYVILRHPLLVLTLLLITGTVGMLAVLL
jgi:hypothetical protein